MAETIIHREHTQTGESLVLRNDHLEVRLDVGAQLVIHDPRDPKTRIAGGPLIELASARAVQRPRTVGMGYAEASGLLEEPEHFEDAHGSGVRVRRRYPLAVQPVMAEWVISVYDDHGWLRLELILQNVGDQAISIRRLFPLVCGTWWGNGALALAGRRAEFAAYKNGWQSWSYSGGLPVGHADPRPWAHALAVWHNPGGRNPRAPVGGRVDVVGDAVLMLGVEHERVAILAGALSQRQWFTQVYADRDKGALAIAHLTDDVRVQPGEELRGEPVMLALGAQDTLLTQYAETLAREREVWHEATAPTGWCSWYHYYGNVTEPEVRENVAALQSLRSTLPLDVVQVDDGYQAAIGDWLEVKNTFPHGMEVLARHIRQAGYRPGIWIAPFTVAANSRLYREHPDWVVRDRKGRPASSGKNWNVALYGLDTTHPGARQWLRDIFRTLVVGWGFEYLKLDFLASAAIPGIRYDPTVTRAEALRAGLALIREVVGDDVFLLGCGCPLLAAMGLVDAMRIGPDVAPYWSPRLHRLPLPFSEGHVLPNLEGAIRNTLTRAWAHPSLWLNDPDCLLVRETQTELTLDEVRAYASAIGLTGGMVLISDPLSHIPHDRLEIVAKLLPPMRERAQPRDYFAAGIPERVAVEIRRPWGNWLLLGLFNGSGSERELTVAWDELGLAPGEYHAVEFWTGTYLGLLDGAASVRVPAHGAAVLAIHGTADEPQLLSSSFHIGQGAVEITEWRFDRERSSVQWRAQLGRDAAGTFTLWLPPSLSPHTITSTARRATWQRAATGEVIVTAEIRDEAHFTLELESQN